MRLFFINTPGRYILHKGLADFYNKSVSGILHSGPEAGKQQIRAMDDPANPGRRTHEGRNAGGFYIFPEQNAPGKLLKSYLPKQENVKVLLEATLRSSTSLGVAPLSTAVAEDASLGTADAVSGGAEETVATTRGFRATEKVMRKEMWEFHGGSSTWQPLST